MAGQVSQRQGRQHKHNRGNGCGFAQKCGCSGTAEQRLAGAAAECSPHVGSFAGLKQNDHDQRNANNNMNDDQKYGHNVYGFPLGPDESGFIR